MFIAGDEADRTADGEDEGSSDPEEELSADESVRALEEKVEQTAGKPGNKVASQITPGEVQAQLTGYQVTDTGTGTAGKKYDVDTYQPHFGGKLTFVVSYLQCRSRGRRQREATHP